MSYTNGLDKPTDYFNTVLYTGNNGSNRSITGVGFQPSFVWNKNRSASANHNLWNEVTGITERLTSSGTQASEDYSSEFLSFDSDGVTITQNVASLDINNSSYNYVLWNWLAGGTASSNTDGSITSTVSANTTAGFSIVSYTGTGSNATVGHGLGVAPSMIINKCRSAAQNWATYHSSLGGTKALFLDGTDAETSSVSYFNNTNPTSSVFSVGNSGDTNKSSQTHISYCFAEKKGFSKFGSYTGNGHASDGPLSYLGFSPAFVLVKRSDSADSWRLFDNKRSSTTHNPNDKNLFPNLSNAEGSVSTNGVPDGLDFLSNSFKVRQATAGLNASGGTYIYMAFAESPFVTSTGIPTTAR